MVRAKNVASTMLQSFVAIGVISILWIVVGFRLAFGDSVHGLIGNPATFLMFSRVGTSTHHQEEIGLDLSQHGEVMEDAVTLAPEPLLAKTA